MKNKILILLVSLFSIFIISDRVEALTFDKCGSSITVNSDNYPYYLYSRFTSEFNNYSYFVFFTTSSYYYVTFYNVVDNVKLQYFKNYNFYQVSFNSTPNLKISVNSSSGSPNYTYNGISGESRINNVIFTNDNYTTSDLQNGKPESNIVTHESNMSKNDLQEYFICTQSYNIKYYLNNELYDTITVEGGSSHTLKDNPSYDSATQYWSGWTYDNNIDLTNIQSDVNIYGTVSDKPIYQVKYYINNELYHTDNVIEGDSYTITDYSDYNSYTHSFSGWTYDETIDLSNVRQNIDINGILTEKEKIPVYIEFPITKNDFYSLMVLIGVLILTQIFRVVFPTKGGKDL